MDTRDAYVRKIETQLDEWSAELDSLEARLKKGGTTAEIKYQEQLRVVDEAWTTQGSERRFVGRPQRRRGERLERDEGFLQ